MLQAGSTGARANRIDYPTHPTTAAIGHVPATTAISTNHAAGCTTNFPSIKHYRVGSHGIFWKKNRRCTKNCKRNRHPHGKSLAEINTGKPGTDKVVPLTSSDPSHLTLRLTSSTGCTISSDRIDLLKMRTPSILLRIAGADSAETTPTEAAHSHRPAPNR